MAADMVPLAAIVLVSVSKLGSQIGTKHYWYQKVWNNTQSYFSPFAVLFSVAKFSHKGVWKEEEDHLLKWNLRSDGWELVEGERSSIHPREGGWWTGEWGVHGESSLNPHSHLSLWVEGTETSHAVWLRNLIDSSTLNFCLFFLNSFTFISIVSGEKYAPSRGS